MDGEDLERAVEIIGEAANGLGIFGQAVAGVLGGSGLDRTILPDDPVEHLVPEDTHTTGLDGFLNKEVVRDHEHVRDAFFN